jgi:DNA-binding NarL/FixJ family response regulator
VTEPRPSATEPRPSARIRVMLVDDHALVRAAVTQAITAADIEIVGAVATAEEALQMAPRVRPNVLLVDIDLPGMDGVQLVRELAPRLPETRIVMLTVSTSDRHLLDAMRSGAIGYLTKDISPESLLAAVRGAYEGDLAMDQRLAAHLVRRLVEKSRHAPAATDDLGLANLSDREDEVLRHLAEGLTDREIAAVLTISSRTVGTHVSSILHKLGVRNRAEAARRYRDRG